MLPGGAGREGRAVLVRGEFYVRLDMETGAPLSIIIPAFTSWLERQRAKQAQASSSVDYRQAGSSRNNRRSWKAQAPRHPSLEWHDAETAYRAVSVAVRYSSDLAPMGR